MRVHMGGGLWGASPIGINRLWGGAGRSCDHKPFLADELTFFFFFFPLGSMRSKECVLIATCDRCVPVTFSFGSLLGVSPLIMTHVGSAGE